MTKKIILAVAALAILAAVATLPVQASDIFYYGGHCYSLTESLTWTDAEAAAEAAGGFLVTVNDAAEHQWLTDTFQQESFWIGFHRLSASPNDFDFVWASGQAVTFTNWVEQEPTRGDEIYVAMNQHVVGGWNDLANGTFKGIVEKNCAVPEPSTIIGLGLPMLMVGLGKLRLLRK